MTNGRRLVLAFTFKLGQKQAQLRSAMETVKCVPNVPEVQLMLAAVSTAARCCACFSYFSALHNKLIIILSSQYVTYNNHSEN